MRLFDDALRQMFWHRENLALLNGVREDLDAVLAVANLLLHSGLRIRRRMDAWNIYMIDLEEVFHVDRRSNPEGLTNR